MVLAVLQLFIWEVNLVGRPTAFNGIVNFLHIVLELLFVTVRLLDKGLAGLMTPVLLVLIISLYRQTCIGSIPQHAIPRRSY